MTDLLNEKASKWLDQRLAMPGATLEIALGEALAGRIDARRAWQHHDDIKKEIERRGSAEQQ